MKTFLYILLVVSFITYSDLNVSADIKTLTKELKEVARMISIKTGKEHVAELDKQEAKKGL